ncbi:TetR/AcrR family transcriptional regulator [Amycolatopsis rhabdoformis]|uniref:TetR/AcrR family transcriptional regulator n=1 Tax=Amycolatopsis rhabdoformis TaxID=1448059 RepID=A0ABZ1I7Y5_9PSEU|nr:TetR/AcrR family transcriptional regulator [Amycolatopsis rhabdoformis]WSE29770.1 TetR/AcrR family transcriptional regulator [Amycolatopsis rhabdoformis]
MTKPLRADARRNRDLLLASAVKLFSGKGLDATLDAIAKDAGVGIGTLYRHFPTRESLIEAAYRNELDQLCDAGPELLKELAPDEALRTWMDRFVDYMTTKIGMGDALRAVIASGGDPYAHSRERLNSTIDQLVSPLIASGALRGDIPVDDILISLSGIAVVAGSPGQREQAGRVLDLLVDGLRYRP